MNSSQDGVKWFTRWCFISCWLLLANSEVSYQTDYFCPKTAWIIDAIEFCWNVLGEDPFIVHISLLLIVPITINFYEYISYLLTCLWLHTGSVWGPVGREELNVKMKFFWPTGWRFLIVIRLLTKGELCDASIFQNLWKQNQMEMGLIGTHFTSWGVLFCSFQNMKEGYGKNFILQLFY